MHASSMDNMQRCYERYLGRSPRAHLERVRVLDVGGANVNGTYSDIFSDPRFEYIGADTTPGDGVGLVLDDPERIPLPSGSVDIVVCGQTFEHVPLFWRLFEEMVRVLHPDGLIVVIVPSSGPVHRYPVDCYRFLPDSMSALARHGKIGLLASWSDDKGPWNDVVGVFSHRIGAELDSAMPPLPPSRYARERAIAPLLEDADGRDPLTEKVQGEVPYLDLMERIHARLEPRLYLEIGIRRGMSLRLARCPAVAVDPQPDLDAALPQEHRLYRETSDRFFKEHAAHVFAENRPDLVFIDGMHLFEFALRDFIYAEQYALPSTLVVIDDIYPNHPAQAERRRRTRVWTGDVWKLHACLQECRPDLLLMPLDTGPTGLLLVSGLNPSNRTLSEQYNPLVARYLGRHVEDDSGLRLAREDALSPADPRLDKLLMDLRAARERSAPGASSPLRGLVNGIA